MQDWNSVLTSLSGRIGRMTYLKGILAIFVMGLAIEVTKRSLDSSLVRLVLLVLFLPVLWFSLAISVKRCHDFNKSGWWILLGAIPFVNIIWQFLLLLAPGTPSDNDFGPPPSL